MIPILPPATRRQALAWLRPGDRLADGRRVEQACNVMHRLRPQWWVRLNDGSRYCEAPEFGERPLSELEPLVDMPPVWPRWASNELSLHAEANGFEYYPAQISTIHSLARAGSALIAADVGAGKSLMAISLILLLRPKRCLIIAPQGVITARGDLASQWEGEFAKFAPKLKTTRVSSQHSLNTRDKGCVHLTYMQEALANQGGGWLRHLEPDFYDMIIVDEAHLLQQPKTQMAQALFRMQPRHKYALTATPVGNFVSDCYRLVRWIRPDVSIDLSAKPIGRRPYSDGYPLATYRALAHAVAPIRKIDVRPDLPQLYLHKVMVEAEPDLMAAYRALDDGFTMKDANAGTISRVKLTKLRNLCAESIAKAAQVTHSIRMNPGVFVSARIKQTDLIMRYLKSTAPHLSIGRIDSTMDASLASRTSSEFKSGALDVLGMGIKVAYGHSFPACDTVHVPSMEWSYGSFNQALGRVWRINSQKPVHAYVYLLKDTIEERIFDTVCAKESAAMAALYGETA
jgi:superfamily II DNA or RNA helicase